MAITYLDVLDSMFGSRRFTVGEFARRANNPRAAKLLSELKHRGLVERLGKGSYRRLGPGERPDLRSSEWRRVHDIVLSGPEPKAWSGETALEFWTEGRYRLAPSPYFRVFTLAIPRRRKLEWIRYLSTHRVSTGLRKRVGAKVELELRHRIRPVTVLGEPVVPRLEIERLIKEHPGLYGNAEALLIR